MGEAVEQSLRRLGRRGHRAVAAAVVRGDERIYGCWFPSREPIDQTSLFEIGSVTKAFTGVLLGDMVLAGEVALDDPLSRHLPSPRPAWRYREPTLLELATHRSGLPNTPGPTHRRELAYAVGLGGEDPWSSLTQAEYERLVAAESPRRARGRRVRYSSMAVGLLGDALAARAGASYEDLLGERILRPLGMHGTSVQVAPDLERRVASGHSRRGQPRPPIQDFMPAAGSLRSSAEEMLRFLSACLQPPGERPGPALAQQPHARKPHDRNRAGLNHLEAPKAPTRRLAQRRHLGLSQLRGIFAGVGHCDHRPLELGSQRRPARVPARRPAAIGVRAYATSLAP
jgi:CubicO group peptidase (beta-lactamase class C family)